jgi:hypothetical protein
VAVVFQVADELHQQAAVAVELVAEAAPHRQVGRAMLAQDAHRATPSGQGRAREASAAASTLA